MSLIAGSITIDLDGSYSGDGFALALMNGEVAQLDAFLAANPGTPYTTAQRIATLGFMKVKVETQAAGIAAVISAADVRVPANGLGAGVPATTTVLTGAVE